MKLSILDQAPISANQTAQQALNASLQLAQAGEKLGYTRYWIAEHHDLPGLACPAPEVILPYIGANTEKIRIGSGAVLLPHYKPYKMAEVFNLLATLFPNRIDFGIGRAPGGSAEATNALSDHFLQNVWAFPDKLKDLLHFLYRDFPEGHEFASLSAAPIPPVSPQPWLLGTSKKSSLLAAELGLPYVFGQFMSDSEGETIIQNYLSSFQARKQGDKPYVILTVSAICAETDEKAEEVALSSLIWSLQSSKGERDKGVPSILRAKNYPLAAKDHETLNKMRQKVLIGGPKKVYQKLEEIQARYQADEIMIVTITHDPKDRLRSYQLLSKAAF
ncbi:LLM class flavin-dependent oxidoreductase [Neobacillus dielmonensis]|uniref:LLM class flavin-dependent oxidoreductase n=1 Tax=Neobacillus dielmonensis TaxID=1347369 RepID=UPI0005A6BC81|nr:LLM class flavin-dependent oxidoreductase [Neobacillus dielmonensis]